MTHSPPGELLCPMRRGVIGAGRCVELQADGCRCPSAADPALVAAAMRSPASIEAPAAGRRLVALARRVRDRAFRRGAADGVGIDVLAEAWGVCERTVARALARAKGGGRR